MHCTLNPAHQVAVASREKKICSQFTDSYAELLLHCFTQSFSLCTHSRSYSFSITVVWFEGCLVGWLFGSVGWQDPSSSCNVYYNPNMERREKISMYISFSCVSKLFSSLRLTFKENGLLLPLLLLQHLYVYYLYL